MDKGKPYLRNQYYLSLSKSFRDMCLGGIVLVVAVAVGLRGGQALFGAAPLLLAGGYLWSRGTSHRNAARIIQRQYEMLFGVPIPDYRPAEFARQGWNYRRVH